MRDCQSHKSLNEKYQGMRRESTCSNHEKLSELKKSQWETLGDVWLNWLNLRKEKLFQIGRGCESSLQNKTQRNSNHKILSTGNKLRTKEPCLKWKITWSISSCFIHGIFVSRHKMCEHKASRHKLCEHKAFKAEIISRKSQLILDQVQWSPGPGSAVGKTCSRYNWKSICNLVKY